MDAIVFWHWWVLGFALLITELMLPSTICLWLGLSALVTGLAAWLIPSLQWQTEVLVFAVLSFVTVGAWFRFRPHGKAATDNGLNQRSRNYIGQAFDLVEAIENGHGKVRVEDSVWRVTGPDLPLGATVRVIAVDGATLQVEATT